MKTLNLKLIPLVLLLLISVGFTANFVSAGQWMIYNKVWNDGSIDNTASTTYSQWGANVDIEESDMDDLGVLVATGGFFQKGWSKIVIDGTWYTT